MEDVGGDAMEVNDERTWQFLFFVLRADIRLFLVRDEKLYCSFSSLRSISSLV